MPKKSPTPDFGYTPEQIKEMQDFFKSSDFTENFSLQHEVELTGAKAEVFQKAKNIFVKYFRVITPYSRACNFAVLTL